MGGGGAQRKSGFVVVVVSPGFVLPLVSKPAKGGKVEFWLVVIVGAGSKAHPEAEKALSEKMQGRISQMLNQLPKSFSTCMSHLRVVKAIEAFQEPQRTDIAR